jgi:hypothetical protein
VTDPRPAAVGDAAANRAIARLFRAARDPGVIDDAASVAQPLQSMRGRIECDYGEPATPAPLTLLHAGCPQRQASAALSDTGDSTRLRQCSLQ